MGCSSCGGGGGNNTYQYAAIQQHNLQVEQQAVDCQLTGAILTNWQTILLCIKTSNKGYLVALEGFEMNRLLGIVQSALNYPNNYCFYKPQLENFQTNVLPLIIENVPECVN